MEIAVFLRAVLIGFTIAAALGPIGFLCIQRTLARGWKIGFLSGMGAASADGLYGLAGGLGLTVVTNLLVGQQFWLRLVGGVFLVYLGLKIFFSRPESKVEQVSVRGAVGAYTSIFLLTLSNPMTILSFAAIYAGIGDLGLEVGGLSALLFSLGVFTGSGAWWLVLATGVSLLRSRFDSTRLLWVNRAAGLLIFGFGVVILVSLFQG